MRCCCLLEHSLYHIYQECNHLVPNLSLGNVFATWNQLLWLLVSLSKARMCSDQSLLACVQWIYSVCVWNLPCGRKRWWFLCAWKPAYHSRRHKLQGCLQHYTNVLFKMPSSTHPLRGTANGSCRGVVMCLLCAVCWCPGRTRIRATPPTVVLTRNTTSEKERYNHPLLAGMLLARTI